MTEPSYNLVRLEQYDVRVIGFVCLCPTLVVQSELNLFSFVAVDCDECQICVHRFDILQFRPASAFAVDKRCQLITV